jgi:hypothetical protein
MINSLSDASPVSNYFPFDKVAISKKESTYLDNYFKKKKPQKTIQQKMQQEPQTGLKNFSDQLGNLLNASEKIQFQKLKKIKLATEAQKEQIKQTFFNKSPESDKKVALININRFVDIPFASDITKFRKSPQKIKKMKK